MPVRSLTSTSNTRIASFAKVSQASNPSTAYAVKAIASFFLMSNFSAPVPGHKVPGAQGRIRTFVPRKEEQIYSLPALTTHPPVQKRRACGSPGLPADYAGIVGAGCAAAGWPQTKNMNARGNPIAPNTTFGKISLWSALERNLLCRAAPTPCVPEPVAILNAGAGEGI